jgi:citrate/tricarballylate utilization protein
MLTLIFRDTAAMGSLLVLHLACIAGLFITAPYGKFVHAVYRTLAIARYEAEARQPHQTASH